MSEMHNEKYFDEKEEENLNSSSDEGNASYISSKDEGNKLIHSRFSTSTNIILNYNDLKAGKNLQDAIEKAYGPKGFYCSIQVTEFFSLMGFPTLWK